MKFFNSNSWLYRMLRTIYQGVIGVIIANIDLHFSFIPSMPDALRPVLVAVVMAILSPIMAEIGKAGGDE